MAPLRLRDFRRLAAAYLVSDIGDWLGEVALALIVFGETGSTLATAALLLGTRGLPALVGPAVSARLSALPIRRALPGVYLAEAAAFVALGAIAGRVPWPVVVAIAAVDGALAVCGRGLCRATIAVTLRPSGLLREGNAIINVAFTLGAAFGPPLAGVVIVALGARLALVLDGASFAVAAATLARVAPRTLVTEEDARVGWRRRLSNGLAFARTNPAVRFLLAAQGAAVVFLSAAGPVEVALATQTFGGGSRGYGLLLAAWGVGMAIGGVVFARRRGTSLAVLAALGTAAVGLSYLGSGLAPTLALACAAAVPGGIGNALQWVAVVTLVQDRTPDRHQAAVSTLLDMLVSGLPAVGFALGGVVAAVGDPRIGYVTAGAGVLAVLAAAVVLRPRGDVLAEPAVGEVQPEPVAPVEEPAVTLAP